MAIFTAIGSAVIAGAGALGIGVTAGALTVGAVTAGTVAAGYGVAQTRKSVKLGQQAVSIQSEAAATQRKQEAAREKRSRRASIRSFLRQRSRISQASALGAGDAVSARGGALGSLSSQLGANLGFSTMMSGLSSQYSSLTQQASMLRGRADSAAAMGGLGFQLSSAIMPSGGFGSLGLYNSFEPNMSRTTPFTDKFGYGVG